MPTRKNAYVKCGFRMKREILEETTYAVAVNAEYDCLWLESLSNVTHIIMKKWNILTSRFK